MMHNLESSIRHPAVALPCIQSRALSLVFRIGAPSQYRKIIHPLIFFLVCALHYRPFAAGCSINASVSGIGDAEVELRSHSSM